LTSTSVATDPDGNSQTTLRLANAVADVQVTACIAPLNNPCKAFTIALVPVGAVRIQAVSETQQVVTEVQPVAPVAIRVTDSSFPPSPVFGAKVTFLRVLSRSGGTGIQVVVDDVVESHNSDPVILGSITTTAKSDFDGLATTALWPTLVISGEEVNGLATLDSGSQMAFSLQVLVSPAEGSTTHGDNRYCGER